MYPPWFGTTYKRELSDAETRLAAAQEDFKASDKDVAAIDAQIRKVQGY